MAAERALGREPRDVHEHKGTGYDIESRDPATGRLYFIEVKGRSGSDDKVTLTRTEVLCAMNEPEKFRIDMPRPWEEVFERYGIRRPGNGKDASEVRH